MLTQTLACGDRERGQRRSWALCLGFTACFCFACPGAEPSAMGSGGAGGAPSGSSSSSGGLGGEAQGTGGGGSTSSNTGGSNEGGCDANVLNDPQNCGACGRACLDDDAVAEPRCVQGDCRSFCESGFVNIEAPAAPQADDGCEAEGRRVFVTAETYVGSQLGGLSGADNLCQGLANAQKLGGKWLAWLSAESTNSVAGRFEREPVAPYMLLDATPVADSWDALTLEGGLENPITLTETMSPVAGASANVWTGTTPTGLPTQANCGGWSSANLLGTVGNYAATSAQWTAANSSVPCTSQARLYCFEQ